MSGGDQVSVEMKQQRAVMAALPEDTRRAFRYMNLISKMQSGDTMLMMPFELRIK
jgi:hypothetical protein